MDMDEWDRPTNEDRHPIAYAFEPVRAVGVLVPPEPDYGGEIDDREREVYLSAQKTIGGAYVGVVSLCSLTWHTWRVSAARK